MMQQKVITLRSMDQMTKEPAQLPATIVQANITMITVEMVQKRVIWNKIPMLIAINQIINNLVRPKAVLM